MDRTTRLFSLTLAALAALAMPVIALAKPSGPSGDRTQQSPGSNAPARQQPQRQQPQPQRQEPQRQQPPARPSASLYSITGVGNNLGNPSWGAVNVDQLRFVASAYADRLSAPAGASRLNARVLSSALSTQSEDVPENNRQMSDLVYVFGQFLDLELLAAERHLPASRPR